MSSEENRRPEDNKNLLFFKIIKSRQKRMRLFINSIHSSRVIFTSFIILLIIPLPIFSVRCIGTIVVLPSGCCKNKWLPFCLICSKPIFSSAFTTFLQEEVIFYSFTVLHQLDQKII